MRILLIFLFTLSLSGCFFKRPLYPAHKEYSVPEKTLSDTCNTKECLIKLVSTHPQNAEAHWYLGQIYQQEQDYRQAMHEFDQCIRIDSTFNLGYPYRDRANCWNNLRNDTLAVKDMMEAIKLNPEERYFYVDRGVYLSNIEKNEAALADFSKAVEIFDKFDRARTWKARTLVKLERYEEAMTEYRILDFKEEFVLDPNNSDDIYYRGLAKFKTNDKAGACSDWTKVKANSSAAAKMLEEHCK
jgi:tetratricopeptide (TPR) repeat protein